MPILPTTLLLLLAVPFDALWPDFEAARRGALLVVAGLIACTLPRRLAQPIPRGSILLACFCLWQLVRTFEVTNPGEAWLRAAHILALAVWFAWGAMQKDLGSGLRSVLPATLIVSLYGLSQAMGFHWPEGYAGTGEAVSTLGNRNVAAEFVGVGLVAAAVLAVRGEGRLFALFTLLVAVSYLVVNGSRGGIVAAVIGLGFALAEQREGRASGRVSAIAATALGAVMGFVTVAWTQSAADVPVEAKVQVSSDAVPVDSLRLSTLAVRGHIWKSAISMFDDAPVLGQGAGQFRYEYPRYRSSEEIELSSFGRRFHTFVDTAHNDYIEVLVETGLPGLATLLCFFAIVLVPFIRRGKKITREELASLAVPMTFLALAVIRSPLGNAPTAAFAFFVLGMLGRREAEQERAQSKYRWVAIPAGLLLAWSGLLLLGAEQSMAQYGRTKTLSDLDRAVSWQPSDSRWRSFRVQRLLADQATDPAQAYASVQPDLTEIATIDPYNTSALLRRAEISKHAGDLEVTRQALTVLLQLDPDNPEAALLTAVMLVEEGAKQDQIALVGRGIAALYARPHARLREQLSMHLNSLRAVTQRYGHAKAERLILKERNFVRALDALLLDAKSKTAEETLAAYGKSVRPTDPRLRIMTAYRLLATGATLDDVSSLAPTGQQPPGKAILRLLEPMLAPLRSNPAWQQF